MPGRDAISEVELVGGIPVMDVAANPRHNLQAQLFACSAGSLVVSLAVSAVAPASVSQSIFDLLDAVMAQLGL